MKLEEILGKLGAERSVAMAGKLALEMGIQWPGPAKNVFMAIANDPTRGPANLGGKHDAETAVLRKWLVKYQAGSEGRASRRISNPPGTVADPIIEQIIKARLGTLSTGDLRKITHAHRLAMSAENILGLILEEYLADNLAAYGWHCAWGETIKSVDFVHDNGCLLQVKNRSNSENSSSNKVRVSTKIQKWHRSRADKLEYNWEKLNKICGTKHLSEDSFIKFVEDTIHKNPDCLAIESNNFWQDGI